ncbi:MAG: beta-ketoacyl-ACP synthase III [Armatimonadota bacterium]
MLDRPVAGGALVPSLRSAGILGLGSYAPERVLTNADLERMVETNDEWIVTRTGIRERRVAAPEERTSDLATRAAERALADAGLSGAEIDLVIVATVTGDAPFPAVASLVQNRIGATRAAAFDLGAGCSGFIYALAVGSQFVQTGLYRHVLVVGAESLSRITNWRDRSTCVLFGDGAGAVVLGPVAEGEGCLAFDLGSDGSGGPLLAVEPGGYGHELSTGSDDPLHQSIRMAGSEVFKFAVRVIEESTLRALRQAGLSVADVDCFVPHQANIRIIDAAARRLGLPESAVFSNVERYGNTSAASIPLALDEARTQGRLRAGDTLVMVGFGAGLSWASCVLKWTGTNGVETDR